MVNFYPFYLLIGKWIWIKLIAAIKQLYGIGRDNCLALLSWYERLLGIMEYFELMCFV